MTPQEQDNINWLAMAVSLPTGYIGERCYYDRADKFFFIITELDYVLVDEELKHRFQIQYTEEETEAIIRKINLISSQSTDIVEVPRMTIDERIMLQLDCMAMVKCKVYERDVEDYEDAIQRIANQDHTCGFVLDVLDKANTPFRHPIFFSFWSNYKQTKLKAFTDAFLTANDIPVAHTSLWYIEPARRRMMKVPAPTIQTEPATNTSTKPWWKIW